MHDITINIVTAASPEYTQVWNLREEVLRKPLNMSLKNEDLSMDAEDEIFVALLDHEVIGCLMLHRLDANTVKLRQMAVYDGWQGKNIGRMLVTAAEKHAATKGYKKVSLHARLAASGFYSRLGYTQIGEEFTEVGIPHFLMQKEIR